MDNRPVSIRFCGPTKVAVITIVVDRYAIAAAIFGVLKTTFEMGALALFVGGILSWVLAACIAAGG